MKQTFAVRLVLAMLAVAFALQAGDRAQAYTYAPPDTEPLLDSREAMFMAAQSGFWTAVNLTFESMREEIAYLDENHDPGLLAAFAAAVEAKDRAALRDTFNRAAQAEIIRRLNAAYDSVFDYNEAVLLMTKVDRFHTAIAADLDPDVAQVLARELPKAVDALGAPGNLGVGFVPANRDQFDAARQAILSALGAQ